MRDGDPSPDGAGPLVSARGIEIGHIFQLGRKYTDAFTVDVLGEDGKPVRLTMGSYGVGVSRLVAVIAEQHHDELGLRWPSSVSPFDVHLVIANKDAEARDGATAAGAGPGPARRRRAARRPQASPGVKFKDAELLGVPWIVVVGRGWADGVVELRNRFTGETREVPVDSAATAIATAISAVTHSLPPGNAGSTATALSTCRQRAARTADWVSAVTANARSCDDFRLFEHGPPGHLRRRSPSAPRGSPRPSGCSPRSAADNPAAAIGADDPARGEHLDRRLPPGAVLRKWLRTPGR